MSLEIQWTDTDPITGERRFVAVVRFAREWKFRVRNKRREDWNHSPKLTREMWETLLDGLERRYQRREGVRDEDLVQVRRILADWSDGPTLDEE